MLRDKSKEELQKTKLFLILVVLAQKNFTQCMHVLCVYVHWILRNNGSVLFQKFY